MSGGVGACLDTVVCSISAFVYTNTRMLVVTVQSVAGSTFTPIAAFDVHASLCTSAVLSRALIDVVTCLPVVAQLKSCSTGTDETTASLRTRLTTASVIGGALLHTYTRVTVRAVELVSAVTFTTITSDRIGAPL
ncbi:hypothetical protein NP493_656g01015 [Ridgeia piscesae]|uniref:Uncharacterized protein n=1 Tax=Ridgeia piscesae TaxID=27915 RepID=A0AAD9KRY7_RIDPI|nr:hypothetical protein NP493_656g01015 [Ridgeia piscesae]